MKRKQIAAALLTAVLVADLLVPAVNVNAAYAAETKVVETGLETQTTGGQQAQARTADEQGDVQTAVKQTDAQTTGGQQKNARTADGQGDVQTAVKQTDAQTTGGQQKNARTAGGQGDV